MKITLKCVIAVDMFGLPRPVETSPNELDDVDDSRFMAYNQALCYRKESRS